MRATIGTANRTPVAAVTALASLLVSVLAFASPPASALTTLAVITPSGGEVWSGGSAHDVVWDLTTDTGNTVQVEYLLDGTPNPIETRGPILMGRYTTPWTLPMVDHGNVTIRVCAVDVIPWECATSPSFRIDGMEPILTSRAPEWTNVGLTEPLRFTFSERMNGSTLAAALSAVPTIPNATWVDVSPGNARVDHDPLLPGTTYALTLSCAATDWSEPGLPLAGCPITWTFTTSTAPTIMLASPVGGEVWSGGSVHSIEWAASDMEDPLASLQVSLELSFDGATWSPVAGPVPGDARFDWGIPRVDAASARVRAIVTDTKGLETTATSASFAIDSTPPRIAATVPSDGASNVGWTSPVIVEFSEPVVGPLDAGTFSLRTATGASVPGTLAWETAQRFRFTPSASYVPFATYIARLNPTLRDSSDPGNAFLAAVEWRFVTKPNNAPTIGFTAKPDGVISGGSSWTVAWAATDPDDAPAALSVYLELFDGTGYVRVAGPLPASSSLLWTAPLQSVAAASLLVRVVDSQGTESTASVVFAIDATPPTIVAANPAPGEIDVAPGSIVELTFSEPVRTTTVSVGLRDLGNGAWVGLIAQWSPDSTVLRLTPAATLRELAAYEVVVDGTAKDLSVPGNLLAAVSWTFRVASFPPTVAILEPAPGVRWTAGVPQTLRILAADGLDPAVTVHADLTLDGVSFVPLLSPTVIANGPGTFSVTPPIMDSSATLRVCATDGSGVEACESSGIVLDSTRPRLLATTPASGSRQVHPDAPIVLTFSEPMDPASVEASFSMSPSAAIAFRWGRTAAENDTLLVEHDRLLELRSYTISLGCTAKDRSTPGLALSGVCPRAWSFATAATPSVRLLSPAGGERLTGGATVTVRWTSADEDGVAVTAVDLSVDDGVTFPYVLVAAEPMLTGETSVARILPAVDTANARIRVRVQDATGLLAVAVSGPFAIDAARPTILSVTPADGATEVSPLADLVVTFSESMDPTSLPSLAVTPALRETIVTWSRTNVPCDTLRVSHAAVRLGTSVRITLDGMRDASVPGNVFSGGVSFTIAPDRERPKPAISVDAEASAGELIVLDATASTDNDAIADYRWTVADADGRTVARMHGDRVEWRAAEGGAYDVSVEVVDAAGNAADARAPLLVHALGADVRAGLPGMEVTMFGWLALLGAGGSSAYGATDRGRSTLSRVFLAPLYVKLKGPVVLDQKTRGMIAAYIRMHPGDCYTGIMRSLGLANGEAAYHLEVLEREGFVKSRTRGAKRLFYPADMRVPENGELHPMQVRVLRQVAEVPGMTIPMLAEALGVGASLAWYHVRKLAEMDLVALARWGTSFRVYAAAMDDGSSGVAASPPQAAIANGGNGGNGGSRDGVASRQDSRDLLD